MGHRLLDGNRIERNPDQVVIGGSLLRRKSNGKRRPPIYSIKGGLLNDIDVKIAALNVLGQITEKGNLVSIRATCEQLKDSRYEIKVAAMNAMQKMTDKASLMLEILITQTFGYISWMNLD